METDKRRNGTRTPARPAGEAESSRCVLIVMEEFDAITQQLEGALVQTTVLTKLVSVSGVSEIDEATLSTSLWEIEERFAACLKRLGSASEADRQRRQGAA